MQQRFIKLTTENKVINNTKPIEKFLASTSFDWLLNCELDNVELEIKDNILYVKEGVIYWGNMKWFVFDKGEFRSGTWEGGICNEGKINKSVKINNGVIKSGEFKGEWNNGKKIRSI